MSHRQKSYLIIGLCVTLIVSVTLFFILSKDKKEENKDPKYTFSLNDYTTYKDDKLDFNLAVISISITQRNDLKETIELKRFKSGDFLLSDFESYETKIKEAKGNLDLLKVQKNAIVFSDHKVSVRLFVPYTKDKALNEMNLSFDGELVPNLKINLLDTAKLGNIKDLGIVEKPTEPTDPVDPTDPNEQPGDKTGTIVGDSLKEIFNKEDFKYVGEDGTSSPSPLSSKSSVFAMPISFKTPQGETWRIESAVLSVGGTAYKALSKNYQIEGYKNISDVDISNETKGYLFFETIQYTVVENSHDLKINIKLTNGNMFEFVVVLA